MPIGHYDRTAGTNAVLRRRMLAVGAEVIYRDLQKQLAALRRAYPALAKFDQAPNGGAGPHTDPAPSAMTLFKNRQKRHMPAPRKTKSKTRAPATGYVPKPGTLIANAVLALHERGPMTCSDLAQVLHSDYGWKPATATTAEKRSSAISVVLRGMIARKRNLVQIVDEADRPYVYRTYGQ